ncbi:MAG: hypothetical protein ACYTFQ_27735 [Planctomycetota bacterium]|jgi:hypothetical protein
MKTDNDKQYCVMEASSAESGFRYKLEEMLNSGWELVSLKFYRLADGEPWGFAVLRGEV